MIRNAKESHSLISTHLPTQVDPFLRHHDFRRRGNSHRYTRAYYDAKQKIEIVLAHTHDTDSRVVAQILPYLEFCIPAVNEIALEMVKDVRLLANAPHITLRQQLNIAIPSSDQTTWYYKQESECKEALDSVKKALEKWGIPFLDEYASASSITANYEAGDDRIFSQKHWYIFVSAAYLLQDLPGHARKVLETKLTGYWTRKRFANAIEYVENLTK